MHEVHEDALAEMRSKDGRWAAYENKALDSANAGHLQFLKFGDECTFNSPPLAYPTDTAHGMGWRYLFVGEVDLATGIIKKMQQS